jgi:hypothetical protein
MKNLFLILFITMSFCSMAQKWAVPGAKWDYRYNWLQFLSSPSISVLKDTTVIGVNCKQIGSYDNKMWYTYESNDTVFFYVGGKFYPTYYYNASSGDTLSFYTNRGSACALDTILYAVVDSVTLINQSSIMLKKYNLTWLNNSIFGQSIYNDFYVERLGFQSFIYPHFTCFIDDEIYVLCSYSDNDLSQSISNIFCTTDITKTSLSSNIVVSPSPANDYISIKITNAQHNRAELIITDLLGRTISKQTLLQELTTFSTQDWANGMYVWSMVEDGRLVQSGKLVKE